MAKECPNRCSNPAPMFADQFCTQCGEHLVDVPLHVTPLKGRYPRFGS